MKLLCPFLVLFLGTVTVCHADVSFSPAGSAPLRFAAVKIEPAAREVKQSAPNVTISVETGAAQSYRIERDGAKVRVIGGDAAGAMDGGLDIAEAVRIGSLAELKSGEHRPHIEFRGIKFNIPLDVRTPRYSDNASAARANIPEMWSREFWGDFLDEMARHRFNVLSLWNFNPFPSIVKVPEFPDVALNEVLHAKPEHFDEKFSCRGGGMFKPAMLDGAEVVKRLSIDEKIACWGEVMQMAKDRGVGVYWFT